MTPEEIRPTISLIPTIERRKAAGAGSMFRDIARDGRKNKEARYPINIKPKKTKL